MKIDYNISKIIKDPWGNYHYIGSDCYFYSKDKQYMDDYMKMRKENRKKLLKKLKEKGE